MAKRNIIICSFLLELLPLRINLTLDAVNNRIGLLFHHILHWIKPILEIAGDSPSLTPPPPPIQYFEYKNKYVSFDAQTYYKITIVVFSQLEMSVWVQIIYFRFWCFKERMETANKQLATKDCEGSEDNRKTISQLLTQSEWHTHTHTYSSKHAYLNTKHPFLLQSVATYSTVSVWVGSGAIWL